MRYRVDQGIKGRYGSEKVVILVVKVRKPKIILIGRMNHFEKVLQIGRKDDSHVLIATILNSLLIGDVSLLQL